MAILQQNEKICETVPVNGDAIFLPALEQEPSSTHLSDFYSTKKLSQNKSDNSIQYFNKVPSSQCTDWHCFTDRVVSYTLSKK